MGAFNKFATPDVEEEKARMRALVEIFKDNNKDDDENEEEPGDEKCLHSIE